MKVEEYDVVRYYHDVINIERKNKEIAEMVFEDTGFEIGGARSGEFSRLGQVVKAALVD
jgi:hypothetical protein